MKIIFLNAWLGTLKEPLEAFFREHASSTDIWCLEEASHTVREICTRTLPHHTEAFLRKDILKPSNNAVHVIEQATYAAASCPVRAHNAVLADAGTGTGVGLYTHHTLGTKDIHILNVHGFPWPGKLDTEQRMEQSRAFLEYMEQKDGVKIIGGDFNMLPDTKSLELLRAAGYRDVIREFGIATTRNRYAWEQHPGNELYHSDYIFIKGDVQVKEFTVPTIEISDHLPLILEVE